jgi:hypothetical protein
VVRATPQARAACERVSLAMIRPFGAYFTTVQIFNSF